MKLLGGLPAMAWRPLARLPRLGIGFSGQLPSPAGALNFLQQCEKRRHHESCAFARRGGQQCQQVFPLGDARFAIGFQVGVKVNSSPNVGRCRKQALATWAVPEVQITELELPQKAPARSRKRITKLKNPSSVDIHQSSPSQTSVPVGGVWSNVELWVVFSDLHFSRRTRDTCLQVLEAVHAEASARKAGIIFLGDFWHARGALPVELLNVVVAQLAKWTCPAVFIPGNHDQVNMGGQMHALMVLGAVNPLIKVFDEPVEFLDALWLPFRRDHNLIKQALGEHLNVKAIFAHLDVVGAFMNEAWQAKEGIEPEIFPKNIPVFTGHYHKPHIVKNSQIEYIGSPYQVSASEIGQVKRFVLLNSSWEKVGEVSIDIGGRHFVISDAEKLALENVQHFRSGDHLRLLLSSTLLEEPMKANVESLRTRGVQIDLVFPTLTAKPRIEEAENLDAFELFNLYAERVEMRAGARSKGEQMLRSMDLPAKLIKRPQVKLVLGKVEIQGFGPYLEPVDYPLAERGIRVVCGRNMDAAGADSNGAGKSTLVMAPLWALSGSTDPRPDSMRGLLASDVIHEKAKKARVYVEGTLNGHPFSVERIAGRKSSLKFCVDGEDHTGQDTKLTQANIDEFVDTSMLQRVAFHGQYGIGGLLEASDKDFKDELSRVVAMDVWIAAKKKSLQDLRSVQTEVDSLEGALAQLQQQKDQIARKVEESAERIQEWENAQEFRRGQVARERDAAVKELASLSAKCSSEFLEVHRIIFEMEILVQELERVLAADMETWHGLRNGNGSAELDKKKHETLITKAAEVAVELHNAEGIAKVKRKKIYDYRMNVSGLDICDKCLQPIDSEHISQSLAQLEEELTLSERICKMAVDDEMMARRELQLITEAMAEQARSHEEDLRERKKRSVGLRENVNRIQTCVRSAHLVLSPAAQFLEVELPQQMLHKRQNSEELQGCSHRDGAIAEGLYARLELINGGKDQEIIGRCEQLGTEINVAKRMQAKLEQLRHVSIGLDNSTNPFTSEWDALKSVLSTLQLSLEQNKSLYEDARKQAVALKELDTAFGHTGVQSYVLEAALTELQERTARFLEVLSGGSLGLLLRPTKELKRTKVAVETIDRVALVQLSNGATEQRSLRQMSGGERRRLALALALGFAEFAAHKSGLQCDLLVLDEVLQHLDSEGKARVVAVLKGLPQSTILLVSQTHGDVADAFDLVDVVVKQNENARIETVEILQ